MSERSHVPKALRFEVFKRDKFTCQYCGANAPEVVLHCDHIIAVINGGRNELLNLLTACAGCNLGKGKRLLDDDTVVKKQRLELEALQDRREQIQMMLAWRQELSDITNDTIAIIEQRFASRTSIGLDEAARAMVRRWLKKYQFEEILCAIEDACDWYLEWEGDCATPESCTKAFRKVPGLIGIARESKDKPYLLRLLYVQGILRRRCGAPRMNCVEPLEQLMQHGADVDMLERVAKRSDSWDSFLLCLQSALLVADADEAHTNRALTHEESGCEEEASRQQPQSDDGEPDLEERAWLEEWSYDEARPDDRAWLAGHTLLFEMSDGLLALIMSREYEQWWPSIDAVEGMIELGLGPNEIAEAERSAASWDQFIDRLHAALHAKLEAAA
jgi:hypothetical protein